MTEFLKDLIFQKWEREKKKFNFISICLFENSCGIFLSPLKMNCVKWSRNLFWTELRLCKLISILSILWPRHNHQIPTAHPIYTSESEVMYFKLNMLSHFFFIHNSFYNNKKKFSNFNYENKNYLKKSISQKKIIINSKLKFFSILIFYFSTLFCCISFIWFTF